jgi:AcrR family transcriptional regulator
MGNARERIIEAADKLFGEVGFNAASTREIAERSNVNKALIHYHFKNKEGLFVCVLERYYERLTANVKNAFQAGGDLRQKMHLLVNSHIDFLQENLNFNRIVQREAAGGKHLKRIHGYFAPIFKMAESMIHQAFPTTRSGEMAAVHLLVSYYGMIVTYFTFKDMLEQLTREDPLSKENLEIRKKHLIRMIDVVIDSISTQQD